jgi:hypothetical protein
VHDWKHFSSSTQWPIFSSMEHQTLGENLKSTQVFNLCHIYGLLFNGDNEQKIKYSSHKFHLQTRVASLWFSPVQFSSKSFSAKFFHSHDWVLNMKTLSKSSWKRFQRKLNRANAAKQGVLNRRLATLVSRWNYQKWLREIDHNIKTCLWVHKQNSP